ncbi:MAG: phosphomannose isomerase type II C-terminal cupin domain [Patescibacteria group bacterium]
MALLYQLSYLGNVRTHYHILKSVYTGAMEGLEHYEKEERPWGAFERFTLNQETTVKIITVKEGEAFSLQTHEHRDEYWRVLSGVGTVRIGDTDHEAHAGDSFFVPRHTEHRVTGGEGGITFLEIAFGTFDESDIERLDDRYGRT